MTIKISKEARAQSIASIERFFAERMEEPPGNLGAGELLSFFLEEVRRERISQVIGRLAVDEIIKLDNALAFVLGLAD